MNNNIFVSTTFLPDGKPLVDALSQFRDAGINSVEIGSNHCYEENYNYLAKFPSIYLIHNYFPIPNDSFVLNIASIDESIRERSIRHIKTAIDFCSEIGGKLYTFHPGFVTDPKGPNISKHNYDFQWDDKQSLKSNQQKADDLMYRALEEIVKYAKLKNTNVAIETEGSFHKKEYLLMQQPADYNKFMTRYSPTDIGINLNIGHLRLASDAFGFKRNDFVDLIQKYIVAMELSHNNGLEDQHLPLQIGGWYWGLISDPLFAKIYKILEFRNTSITAIVKNIKLIKQKINAV